jgi:hypothetical protein
MRTRPSKQTVEFLRTIETCTQALEFMSEEKLNRLPEDAALHIEELEDLLSRLSLEATAVLFDLGYLPFRGRK